jgi:Tol biopolymer transport system component
MRTGELRQITSPPAQGNPGDGDSEPAVSPDGQTLAFVRRVAWDGDIFVQPLAGGPARRVTKRTLQMGSLVWAGNRELVYCAGAIENSSLWRVPVDGHAEPEPVLGAIDGCRGLALINPATGPSRMAYGRIVNDLNVWRMQVALEPDGRVRTVAEPEVVIASTRADYGARFSPDGKQIVFASDRDGHLEIWVSASDGSSPSQLTTLKSPRCGSPRWSPDGRQITFDSLASGNNDIWIVRSDGGLPKHLTTEPSNDARPAWSGDGRWIYFRSDRSGSQQIWKIPSSEPYNPAVQVTRNGGFEAIESIDGKLLYYSKTTGGLWSMPVEGGEETPVLPSVTSGYWAPAKNGIYYLDFGHRSSDGATPVKLYNFSTRKTFEVGVIHKQFLTAAPGFSATPDGRWIAWAQIDHQDLDLMLIDNFR